MLNKNELVVLNALNTNDVMSLAKLSDSFLRRVKVPARWTHKYKVSRAQRRAFCAALVTRNAMRRLVQLGLVERLATAIYSITEAGRAEVAS